MILFDEIEKAHPEVFNTLLQLLDDGRLTDSKGKTVNFKDTVVIMTSNIGSNLLLDGMQESGEISDAVKENVLNILRANFKPEFLNRIDDIVMFKPLTKSEIVKIVELSLADIQNRLRDRNIKLEVSEDAKNFIADNSYSKVYGARPVKRYLQKHIETPIARLLIQGEIQDYQTIYIDKHEADLSIGSKI